MWCTEPEAFQGLPFMLGIQAQGCQHTAPPGPAAAPHPCPQTSGASASFGQILPLVSLSYNPPSLYFENASLITQLKAYFVTLRVFDTDHGDDGVNSKYHVD